MEDGVFKVKGGWGVSRLGASTSIECCHPKSVAQGHRCVNHHSTWPCCVPSGHSLVTIYQAHRSRRLSFSVE